MSAGVFARHLDLTPLRGRSHGLVRCWLHDDRSPSLSLDLDRGVFHCFSCGVGGGVKKFRELVGEVPAPSSIRRSRESEQQRAGREVLERERRAAAMRVRWLPSWLASDYVRECAQQAAEVRALAAIVGPDADEGWVLLDFSTAIEREALNTEAVLDGLLAERRIP